jgi:hypothetical protein
MQQTWFGPSTSWQATAKPEYDGSMHISVSALCERYMGHVLDHCKVDD